jgi:hypothetical protein
MAHTQKPPRRLVERAAADGCLLSGLVVAVTGVYVLWGTGVALVSGGCVLTAVGVLLGLTSGRGG